MLEMAWKGAMCQGKNYCSAEKPWPYESNLQCVKYIGWHENHGLAHFVASLALTLITLLLHTVLIWGFKLHVAGELLTSWALWFLPALKQPVKISSKEWQSDWEMLRGGVISATKIFQELKLKTGWQRISAAGGDDFKFSYICYGS